MAPTRFLALEALGLGDALGILVAAAITSAILRAVEILVLLGCLRIERLEELVLEIDLCRRLGALGLRPLGPEPGAGVGRGVDFLSKSAAIPPSLFPRAERR